MFHRNTSRWTRLTVIAVSGLLAFTLASSDVIAVSQCKNISGRLLLQPVTGPECASPVGICATGSFSGGLRGSFAFTGSSLVPTVDTPTTSVVLLTGDNLIQTGGGTLMTKDAIVFSTTGDGDFAEVDTIIGGTGEWEGATGHISAVGTFTAAGGEGDYTGDVCTP